MRPGLRQSTVIVFLVLVGFLCGCSEGREAIEPRRLTAHPGDETSPTFSPDSRFVAFSYTDGDSRRIGVLRLSDGGTRSLTLGGRRDDYPAWSADGKFIAFSSDRDGNEDIYTVSAETGEGEGGTSVVRLTNDPAVDRRPTWKPDGTMLAFESNRNGRFDIWTMKSDGSEQVALTRDTSDDTCPAWSPDGTLIALTSTRTGNRDIYVMNPDGSHPIHITDKEEDEWCARWTPDSKRFVHLLRDPHEQTNELWTVDRRGMQIRQICATRDDLRDPTVSPDGKWLAFSSNHEGSYDLYLLKLDD